MRFRRSKENLRWWLILLLIRWENNFAKITSIVYTLTHYLRWKIQKRILIFLLRTLFLSTSHFSYVINIFLKFSQLIEMMFASRIIFLLLIFYRFLLSAKSIKNNYKIMSFLFNEYYVKMRIITAWSYEKLLFLFVFSVFREVRISFNKYINFFNVKTSLTCRFL